MSSTNDLFRFNPAMVAWFVKASVFHSVNSAPSANGGSNPAYGNNFYGPIYQIQVDNCRDFCRCPAPFILLITPPHHPPMHRPMHPPMHHPACPSTPTPFKPHLTYRHRDYMILLLGLSIQVF